MTNQSADGMAAENLGEMIGYFGGALLIAFLVSRLGLYIRRSSRFEPSTVVGVHVVCFFILGLVACSSRSGSSSGLTAFFAQLAVLLIDYFRLPDPDEYHDDEPQRAGTIKPLGYVLIGAALLLGFVTAPRSQRPVTDETIAADVERGMASTPGGRLYLDAIKRNFPDDHRAMVESMVRRVRENGVKRISPEFRQQVEADVVSRFEALLTKHRTSYTHSPAGPLNASARANRDFVLQAQREAPEICAAYALGAPTMEQMKSMPASMQLPAARMTVAMLDAAKAGVDKPVRRDLSKPPTAIIRQLLSEVRARLGPPLGALVGDRSAIAARSVGDRCRVAAALYSGVADLPSESAATATAYNFSP